MISKKAANSVDKHVGSRIRMRRLMLDMSQEKLGDALGLTFQQVQKYEKGANRVGASRLRHIAQTLQVPEAFFFEGVPDIPGAKGAEKTFPTPLYVSEFVSSSDGHALIRAFTRVTDAKLRRCIVDLVEHIVSEKKD